MVHAVPNLSDLLGDPGKVSQLPTEAIPGILGQLETLKAQLWVRLTVPQDDGERTANGDRLLDVKEACQKLGMTKGFLYRNKDLYKFTVRVGRKHVRFSEQGIHQFIQSRQGRKIGP